MVKLAQALGLDKRMDNYVKEAWPELECSVGDCKGKKKTKKKKKQSREQKYEIFNFPMRLIPNRKSLKINSD